MELAGANSYIENGRSRVYDHGGIGFGIATKIPRYVILRAEPEESCQVVKVA